MRVAWGKDMRKTDRVGQVMWGEPWVTGSWVLPARGGQPGKPPSLPPVLALDGGREGLG